MPSFHDIAARLCGRRQYVVSSLQRTASNEALLLHRGPAGPGEPSRAPPDPAPALQALPRWLPYRPQTDGGEFRSSPVQPASRPDSPVDPHVFEPQRSRSDPDLTGDRRFRQVRFQEPPARLVPSPPRDRPMPAAVPYRSGAAPVDRSVAQPPPPTPPPPPPLPLPQVEPLRVRSIQSLIRRFEPNMPDEAEAARQRYHSEILAASDRYGHQVGFTPVVADGRPVGYVLSARPDAASRCRYPGRALLVAGSGERCDYPGYVVSFSEIVRLRAGAGSNATLDIARKARQDGVDPDEMISRHRSDAQSPNRFLDNTGLTPLRSARYVADTAAVAHLLAVDVFVPAPGGRITLDTLDRSLPEQLRYRTILYTQPGAASPESRSRPPALVRNPVYRF